MQKKSQDRKRASTRESIDPLFPFIASVFHPSVSSAISAVSQEAERKRDTLEANGIRFFFSRDESNWNWFESRSHPVDRTRLITAINIAQWKKRCSRTTSTARGGWSTCRHRPRVLLRWFMDDVVSFVKLIVFLFKIRLNILVINGSSLALLDFTWYCLVLSGFPRFYLVFLASPWFSLVIFGFDLILRHFLLSFYCARFHWVSLSSNGFC